MKTVYDFGDMMNFEDIMKQWGMIRIVEMQIIVTVKLFLIKKTLNHNN